MNTDCVKHVCWFGWLYIRSKKGLPPFLGGSPNQTSTRRFALAGGGKFLGDLLDRHSNHLLSKHLERSIGKDPDLKFPHGLSLDSDSHPDNLKKFYTDTQALSTKFLKTLGILPQQNAVVASQLKLLKISCWPPSDP